MPTLGRVAAPFNALVVRLLASRRGNVLVRGWMTTVTYTGRRSGRTISTPVGYRRKGSDVVEITVMIPERKSWWRNFTGEGAPLTLTLDGWRVPGHAVATREENTVRVSVDLTRP